jgi:putative phosphoesterase
MDVGLISDIHANLPALEAVLEDMPPVEIIVCAGDVVGYNPWPAECVERVREVADTVVIGNHDRAVEQPQRYRANRMAEAGLEFAKESLSRAQLQWVTALARRQTVDDEFLLVHDHPEHQDTYVYPAEFSSLDRSLAEFHGAILGHTHIQHAEVVEGRLVVNPGSVGQPRDGDSRAAYAVLDTDGPAVDLRRVAYDIDRVIERIKTVGLPERTGVRLRDGS